MNTRKIRFNINIDLWWFFDGDYFNFYLFFVILRLFDYVKIATTSTFVFFFIIFKNWHHITWKWVGLFINKTENIYHAEMTLVEKEKLNDEQQQKKIIIVESNALHICKIGMKMSQSRVVYSQIDFLNILIEKKSNGKRQKHNYDSKCMICSFDMIKLAYIFDTFFVFFFQVCAGY